MLCWKPQRSRGCPSGKALQICSTTSGRFVFIGKDNVRSLKRKIRCSADWASSEQVKAQPCTINSESLGVDSSGLGESRFHVWIRCDRPLSSLSRSTRQTTCVNSEMRSLTHSNQLTLSKFESKTLSAIRFIICSDLLVMRLCKFLGGDFLSCLQQSGQRMHPLNLHFV